MSRVVLDEKAIARALDAVATRLLQQRDDAPFAIVGIHKGGEPLAQRLAGLFAEKTGKRPPLGSVDITLYRDDGFGPHDWPEVGATALPFDIKAHTVVLADDVLYTGRTVRAALDVILDYGRPKAVRLAVLVDRGQRELPIRADAVGLEHTGQADEYVDVRWREHGAEADGVFVGKRQSRPAGAEAKS